MSHGLFARPFSREGACWEELAIALGASGPTLAGRTADGTADPSTLAPSFGADTVTWTGLTKNTQTAGSFWRAWWALDTPPVGGWWPIFAQLLATPETLGAICGIGIYNGTDPTTANGVWAAVWKDVAGERLYLQANNTTGYSSAATGAVKVAFQVLAFPVPPADAAIRSHCASAFDDGGNVLQGEERAVTTDWASGDTLYLHFFLGAKNAAGDVTASDFGGVVGFTDQGLGD